MGGKLLLPLWLCAFTFSAVHAMQLNGQFHGSGRGHGFHREPGHKILPWDGGNIPWSGNSSNSGSGGDGANAGGGTSDTCNSDNAKSHDPIPYCHWYACTAIDEAHAARETPLCSGLVSASPSRWSLSRQYHYDRCLSLFGSGQNASEHRTRIAQLDQCFNR